MRVRAYARAAIAALALAGTQAGARIVDYRIDPATLEKAAADQLDGPMSPAPARGSIELAFAAGADIDHVTISAGVACSAYKIENPVTELLPTLLAAWDADGRLGGDGAATLRLTGASSFNRCVQLKEFDGRCITRVKLAGSLTVPADGGSVREIPVAATVERSGSVGAFCSNLARFVGIVSREAGIALIADARGKLELP